MSDHFTDDMLPLRHPGVVPRYFVSGLGLILPMGANALFGFHVLRPPTQDDPAHRMIEVELVSPVEAVGPAFDKAITTLGARTMINLAGHAVSHVLGQTARKWLM